VVQADGRYAPLSDKSVEVIVSFEVFEHITEVEKYASEAFRMLKNGGRLILSTPNVEFYPLAGMNPYHVKEYTFKEVCSILENAGFTYKEVYAQIPLDSKIEKLENSRFLLAVMKLKRRFGFHGDILPPALQRFVKRKIAGGTLEETQSTDYRFEREGIQNAELIYHFVKPS